MASYRDDALHPGIARPGTICFPEGTSSLPSKAGLRRRRLIPNLPAGRMDASAGSHRGREPQGAEGGKETDDILTRGLTESVLEVIDKLRNQPMPGSHVEDGWDRIVHTVAENDSLPDSQVKVIERAIEDAYREWSNAQRRAIWHETDSGMTDGDNDDELWDTSFDGIGYALQVEILDEVTQAAWRDAAR